MLRGEAERQQLAHFEIREDSGLDFGRQPAEALTQGQTIDVSLLCFDVEGCTWYLVLRSSGSRCLFPLVGCLFSFLHLDEKEARLDLLCPCSASDGRLEALLADSFVALEPFFDEDV